jgi:hypothetical protein
MAPPALLAVPAVFHIDRRDAVGPGSGRPDDRDGIWRCATQKALPHIPMFRSLPPSTQTAGANSHLDKLWGQRQATRAVVDSGTLDRPAVSTSQIGRFETGWLIGKSNLDALADLTGTWIDGCMRAGRRQPPCSTWTAASARPTVCRKGVPIMAFRLHLLPSAGRGTGCLDACRACAPVPAPTTIASYMHSNCRCHRAQSPTTGRHVRSQGGEGHQPIRP